MERSQLIDSYVLGRMDETSRKEFETMMQEDPELREDVALVQDIRQSLIRRERNLMQLKSMKEEMARRGGYVATRSYGKVVPWKTIISVAAACMLLFVGISYPYSYYGLQDRGFMTDQIRGDIAEGLPESLAAGSYDTALDLIDASVNDLLASLPTSSHKEYVMSEIRYLEWARIQTLLKMKEYELAYDKVVTFRLDAGFFQKDADKLYKRLKVRLRNKKQNTEDHFSGIAVSADNGLKPLVQLK